MNKQQLIDIATDFVAHSEDNFLKPQVAISRDLAGMKLFEAPLLGFAAAEDAYFARFKDPAVIGSHFLHPAEWLPGAKTVMSFFLPYTETIKRSNSEGAWPSAEWLHGRYEGQKMLIRLTEFLLSRLAAAGHKAIAPPLEKRMLVRVRPDDSDFPSFTSNWSERHVAFVCGLGTFGLSRGLITARGMAGRFGSIITRLALSPDERSYDEREEYCTRCGACIRRCPAKAISFAGKDNTLCCDFLDAVKEKSEPRFGCGKCQVGVPCESAIP